MQISKAHARRGKNVWHATSGETWEHTIDVRSGNVQVAVALSETTENGDTLKVAFSFSSKAEADRFLENMATRIDQAFAFADTKKDELTAARKAHKAKLLAALEAYSDVE